MLFFITESSRSDLENSLVAVRDSSVAIGQNRPKNAFYPPRLVFHGEVQFRDGGAFVMRRPAYFC
jgi:hypothetical protein